MLDWLDFFLKAGWFHIGRWVSTLGPGNPGEYPVEKKAGVWKIICIQW